MSPSAYRYQPAADRNCTLRHKIIALAQRHRRYGAGLIYLKLRQAGELVNHKRVERLYALAGLQVKRSKRKKIPMAERHPLDASSDGQSGVVYGLCVRSGGRRAQYQELDRG